MPKYAMVIDLQRCVGCGACSIACRNENNVSEGIYWSSKITETSGTFPNVRYHYRPTLCNHCSNAPCVTGCPTKAMHKLDNGITMHDPDKCIGCQTCLKSCPYAPHRTIWNPAANKATKCDLCVNTPYFSKKGGPSGEQACVTTCPMKALKLVAELPSQTDIGGYDVDLTPPPEEVTPSGANPKDAPSKKQ